MHAFTLLNSPLDSNIASILVPFTLAALLWTVILKGFALWYAARASQKWWFIALLIINTLGILELVYLIWFRPKKEEPLTPAAPAEPSPVS